MKQILAASIVLLSGAVVGGPRDPETWSNSEERAFSQFMTSVILEAQAKKCSDEFVDWSTKYSKALGRWLSKYRQQIARGRALFNEMDEWVTTHPEPGLKPVPAKEVLEESRRKGVERIAGFGQEHLQQSCTSLGLTLEKETL